MRCILPTWPKWGPVMCWHDITLGREMRTLELKREVNELLGQAGQPPRYLSVE